MPNTEGLLARVRARLAVASAVEDLQRGAAAGCVLAALLFALRATPLWRPDVSLIALVALAALLLVPLVGVFVRRYDRRALAARADRALGLAERVSTSVWVETSGGEGGALAPLVVADAAHSASAVTRDALRRAFRPRLLRRDLAVAAVALLAAAGLYLVQPPVAAGETPVEKAARLADEDRIADVARRMAQAAERVKEAAEQQKTPELAKVAATIQRQTAVMARTPPRREAALRKLSELSDLARAAARKRAGLAKPASAPEAARASRELAKLLAQMSKAGIENLADELAELQKRLDEGAASESPPSPDDLRAMAARVDALRRAMAAAEEMGAENIKDKLRSIANEDLLRQIAERMRELAARMEQQPGYEGLQGESGGEPMDISQLSREELEELLKALDEMAGMEDLARMMRGGGGEMSGGRRLRFGGSGGT